jgi:hypothetical protein
MAEQTQPGHHPARARDFCACIFLAALCLAFFAPVLGGRVLLPSEGLFFIDPLFAAHRPASVEGPINTLLVADLVGQHFPWRDLAFRSLHSGAIPLWNPYSACGMPFLANDQSAVLNPTNLALNALFAPARAQTFFALLSLIAACLFTYGLVRSLGGSPLGGMLGGVTFGFGGFVFVWLGYPLAATAAWLPALLWATHHLARRPTLPRAALVAGIIGWQFLSGHLSTSVQMLAFCLVFVIYEVAAQHVAEARRFLALAGIALALGVGLGAPQLVPTAEYYRLSTISEGGRSRWASDSLGESLGKGLLGDAWFLRTVARSEAGLFFAPELRGNPAFEDYRPIEGYGNYAERASYIGALGLVALVSSLLTRRSRGHRRFFAVGAWVVFGILLHLPVFNLAIYLPVLRFAAPHRMRFIFALCGGVAVGLAVTEWGQGGGRRGRGERAALGVALAVVAAIMAAGAVHTWRQLAPMGLHEHLAWLRAAKIIAPVAASIALAAALLGSRRIGQRALFVGLALIAVCDLFVLGARWHPLSRPENVAPELPAIERLRESAGQMRFTGPPTVLRPNLAILYGLYDARAYDPISVRRYVALVETLNGVAPGTAPSLEMGSERPFPALERLTSVGYALRLNERMQPSMEWVAGSLPRAYVAGRVRVVGARDALATLGAGLDPRVATLIEADAGSSEDGPIRAAEIASYGAHRVVIHATAARPAWLVLTDARYPGWRARVEGRPAEIVPANYAFRAVRIPQGESEVVFTYEPTSYRIGVFVGLLSLAWTVGLAMGGAICRRAIV